MVSAFSVQIGGSAQVTPSHNFSSMHLLIRCLLYYLYHLLTCKTVASRSVTMFVLSRPKLSASQAVIYHALTTSSASGHLPSLASHRLSDTCTSQECCGSSSELCGVRVLSTSHTRFLNPICARAAAFVLSLGGAGGMSEESY